MPTLRPLPQPPPAGSGVAHGFFVHFSPLLLPSSRPASHRPHHDMQKPPRFLALWLAAGFAALLILPWYGLDDRLSPPALFAGAPWLWPLALPLLLGLWASFGRTRPRILIAAGAAGLVWLAAEGLLIIHRGWAYAWLTALLGSGPMQPAMGWGAALYALACLMLLAYGLARLGVCKGDVFVVGAILLVVGLIALFVFYPVLCILSSAVRDNDGGFAPVLFAEKLFSASIWSVDCVTRRPKLRRGMEHRGGGDAGRRADHVARARLRAGGAAHARCG